MIKKCENCKKEYFVKPYRYKISRFCSMKCKTVVIPPIPYWKGKKHYKSTKEKISKSHKEKWKGHERKDWEGYIFVRDDSHPFKNYRGYIRKHRKVIEDFIGIIIPKKWEIHHVDKDKENNHISNLMVFINKSAHRRFELGKSKVYKKEIVFDGRIYRC